MLSANVSPMIYKKALLDLKILDESKTYTLKEWQKIPKLKQFLKYLKVTKT
ncbi:hypothetical protein Plhal304r1_c029g0095851 [Plasmopara halstedii]